MTSKILFTHSYFLRFDPKQWKQQQPYPPLGTIYAAATMRESGFSVSLFDPMFSLSPAEIIPHLKKHQPKYVVVYDDGFNYLTKMCLTNMREAAFEMIREAKKASCTVIVNSSDAADHFEKYLDAGADFVMVGEGEITLKELVKSLEEKNKSFDEINGLVFRKNGNTFQAKAREVLRELDSLPVPLWDLIDMVSYRSVWKNKWSYFSLNISTTRGCPFHCNWCAKPIYGNRYNVHSPQHVVDELKVLLGNFGAEHIWMTDDIFGLKPGWVNEFADILQREKIKVRFKIQSRVDLLLQENNIISLARAGCETIWVGAESGSQKILDAMEKGTKVEQIYKATRLMKKYGIKPAFFLQFGYPGEVKEDIDATIKMVMELMPDDIGVSVSYPLPGTKFYDRVKSELKLKANWTDSDELVLMFKNTYPASFYKELQRYIHKHYRAKQGVTGLKNIFSNPAQISRSQLRRIAGLPFYLTGKFVHKNLMNRIAERQI